MIIWTQLKAQSDVKCLGCITTQQCNIMSSQSEVKEHTQKSKNVQQYMQKHQYDLSMLYSMFRDFLSLFVCLFRWVGECGGQVQVCVSHLYVQLMSQESSWPLSLCSPGGWNRGPHPCMGHSPAGLPKVPLQAHEHTGPGMGTFTWKTRLD